jgi:hypothetical protein
MNKEKSVKTVGFPAGIRNGNLLEHKTKALPLERTCSVYFLELLVGHKGVPADQLSYL